MLEWLAQIDRAIFLFLNVQAANPVTDLCMPVITSDTLLRIAYAITVILVLWKGDRRLRWTVLVSAVTLLLTDQLAANFLKNYFDRPRPCHTLPDINLLVNCGAGFSMPSAHAANAFGQAIVWGMRAKHLLWYLLGIAFVIAISRVFVGVHYPGDVLVGGGVGVLIGLLTHTLGSRWISPKR
ncbi:MAG: phosphatase PAP2 family protein [bacterium]|nr:phosphatase PAP2 family protein [bacterium]